jgi:RNA polymerase sigma factor (sigma-70 family)
MRTATDYEGSVSVSEDTIGPDPVVIVADIYPSLTRLARSIVGPDAAPDIVHDTLVEMLARYPRFHGIENPLAYGRVILARLSYSSVSRRRTEIPSTDALEHLSGPLPDSSSVVLDNLQLERALTRLGRRQRACVVLSYLYRLTDREIAEILGCRPSTVRSQTARGLRAIRGAFGSEAGDQVVGWEGR